MLSSELPQPTGLWANLATSFCLAGRAPREGGLSSFHLLNLL